MLKRIWFTAQFEAMHEWPEAPERCGYLRHPHRHIFHVRGEKIVAGDREIEFIELKQTANRVIAQLLSGFETRTWSCERWAEELMNRVGLDRVEISEDGENGATVERTDR